ncbi:hypothetical protein [Streptomyces sp. ISL-98]|uniref:hypothetical protein n=1 Tax=Streptomyces sp. ISL-98 TaxID=2819192 RepID=UPI0027E48550|nr:hypothetical protein [Streptomyces sp. ISL-98]
MIHQLPDRVRVARELARTLLPSGATVVRTTFRERLDALVYDYAPGRSARSRPERPRGTWPRPCPAASPAGSPAKTSDLVRQPVARMKVSG